jgi:hypothetical protein
MSSGFVTEKEIEEQRKLRQEEWDKVRKADDPQGLLKLNYFKDIASGSSFILVRLEHEITNK